jgi:hypothetical protein
LLERIIVVKIGFIQDLFKGPNNDYWDLGRIVAGVSTLSMILGAVWNVFLGLPLELGPAGLGGGLAAVLGGCAALIYAKDRAKAENVVADKKEPA